jgi:hypothetical protein
VRRVLRFFGDWFRWWRDDVLWMLDTISSSGALPRADLARFDRYCELNDITPEDQPAAFADWLAQEIRDFGQPQEFVAVPDDELY